jgi:hypothetical protein
VRRRMAPGPQRACARQYSATWACHHPPIPMPACPRVRTGVRAFNVYSSALSTPRISG